MAPFFSDTFTEVSTSTELNAHTPDVGTSWTRVFQDSTAIIQAVNTDVGRPAANVNDAAVGYTADVTYPSADYEVQFTFMDGGGLATRPMYIGVRYQDTSNVYAVRMWDGASGARLHKKVSGTWTALGTAVTIAAGSVVKLQIIGTTLKLFDDGAEVDSVTVSDISAAGKALFACGGGTWGTASTDDCVTLSEIDAWGITDLGVVAYTLTAATGSFSLTGIAAALKWDHRVTAVVGALSLTGNTALLKRGYPLTATVGTFALSGNAANLLYGRKLAAVVASYALTGTATGLLYGHKLTVTVGAFLLTGVNVTLTYTPVGAFVLAAGTGSFALTGSAAGLLAGWRLAAVVASYSLTGQTAGLLYGHKLTAAVASYSLAGSAASLLYGHKLTAATASYTLTGNAVMLTANVTGVYFYPGTRDVQRSRGRGTLLSVPPGRLRAKGRGPIDAKG